MPIFGAIVVFAYGNMFVAYAGVEGLSSQVALAHFQPDLHGGLGAGPGVQMVHELAAQALTAVDGVNGDVEQVGFVHAGHGHEVAECSAVCGLQQRHVVLCFERIVKMTCAPRAGVAGLLKREDVGHIVVCHGAGDGIERGRHGMERGGVGKKVWSVAQAGVRTMVGLGPLALLSVFGVHEMGSLSIWHWLIVLLVVVMIFGTKKLRNIGSDLGGAVKGFKEGMREDEKLADASKQQQEQGTTIDVQAKEKS